MKLFYFLPKLVHCGPANVVLNNMREITELNPSISIALISYRQNLEDDNFRVSCENLGIKEFYSLDDNKSNFFQKYFYLKKITEDADIIHSNGFFPDLYTSFLPKKITKIATVHSILGKDYPATYGLLKGSIYAVLHHLVYLNPRFDNIIACSRSVENHVKKYSLSNQAQKKITTIHNGINLGHFSKLDFEDKGLLRKELFETLGIRGNNKTKVFIYSGRLARLKRVPELVNWFINLANETSILILLGEGEERSLCEDIAKDATNVYFLGHVTNPIPYYQISDYIVSNSSLEGFPMGVLEGLSCGCVALLSDIEAHREIIETFPSISTLLYDFKSNGLHSSPSENELFYLSAHRMASQYLSIYLKKRHPK